MKITKVSHSFYGVGNFIRGVKRNVMMIDEIKQSERSINKGIEED